MKTCCLLVITALGVPLAFDIGTSVWACGPLDQKPFNILAQQAISTDPAVSAAAVSKLRSVGPDGLDALFSAHESTVEQYLLNRSRPESPVREPSVISSASFRVLRFAIDHDNGETASAFAKHLEMTQSDFLGSGPLHKSVPMPCQSWLQA